jgi:hypothetical protein
MDYYKKNLQLNANLIAYQMAVSAAVGRVGDEKYCSVS